MRRLHRRRQAPKKGPIRIFERSYLDVSDRRVCTRLTHDEPGAQPLVNAIVVSIIEQFSRFVQRLRAVPEGDGTLLDHTVVLGTSDTSFGRTHALTDYPVILAGSACGVLRTGLHHRTVPGDNASKLGLTLLRAMDLRAESFGVGEARADTTIGDIEV
ncbi:MAG: hypothetical protein AAFV29_14790 [Myxococcota bacterium]